MKNLAIDGQDSQVIVLFDYIFRNKNKEIFIQICRELAKEDLANYLEYKLNISEIVQKQNFNQGGTIVQYVQEPTARKNKKDNLDEESIHKKKDVSEDLDGFIFDIDAYQNKMIGLKEDLKRQGLINENKKNEVPVEENNKEENNKEENKKEENKKEMKNNFLFNNAMIIEEKATENKKELLSDLKQLASTSPIKEKKNVVQQKDNNQQKKGKPKRSHKELGGAEKKGKKPAK